MMRAAKLTGLSSALLVPLEADCFDGMSICWAISDGMLYRW